LQEHGYNGDLLSYFGDIYRSANKNYQTKYRKNTFDNTVKDLKSFAERVAPSSTNDPENFVLTGIEINKKTADTVKKELGIDIKDYVHKVSKYGLQHFYKNHIKTNEAKLDDVELIPYILLNPDSITTKKTGERSPDKIIYKKKLSKDIYVYVEEILSRKAKSLITKTFFIQKKETPFGAGYDRILTPVRLHPIKDVPTPSESNNNVIQKNKNVKSFRLSDQNIDDIKTLNQKLFGDENIEIFDQILTESGKEALGQYYNGMIAIMNGRADYKDTYYHEAVHKYLNLFATNAERKAIFAYFTQNSTSRKMRILRKTIAENFIEYAKSREGLTGKIKLFFDRILLRIQNFFGNYDLVKELYGDILQGKARKIAEEASQVKKGNL
jgi:hypothetical protein